VHKSEKRAAGEGAPRSRPRVRARRRVALANRRHAAPSCKSNSLTDDALGDTVDLLKGQIRSGERGRR
jgi:hypothetical protein